MASCTGAKRTRTGLADPPPALTEAGSSPLYHDRDWASLPSGPAGLIAARVLSGDVADYVRFRAACTAWRACSVDPRAQGVADRRFHPRRWIMLPRTYSSSSGRCFLNVSTGECVHVRIPDLRSNFLLGSTMEGLLVLCRKGTHVVQLLNPLTGQLTDFPGADTMIARGTDDAMMSTSSKLRSLTLRSLRIHSAGIADDSTVALLYNSNVLAVAKPGDARWTRFTLDFSYNNFMTMVLPYAGRLYCITYNRILVVEAAAGQQQPRLEPVFPAHGARYELELEAAEPWPSSSKLDWMYPAYDDEGNLILVHRSTRGGHYSFETYTTYQVNLDTGNMVRMRGLGGQALFLCRGHSQSVPARVSSLITADTVYVCNDSDEKRPRVVAFNLIGGSVSVPASNFDENAIAGALWSYVCS